MYSFIIDTTEMGRKKNTLPTLLLHKPSGLAYCEWEGKVTYFCKYGSIEADEQFRAFVANVILGKTQQINKTTVGDLVLAYLNYCKTYYPTQSDEPAVIRRILNRLPSDCERLSPARFMAVRQQWIDQGKSISSINKWHGYVLAMYRWAAMMELIDASQWHALQTVGKLRAGRTSAKQPRKVKPVDYAHVEAIKEYVSETVWMMIRLQYFTGMRSGEVLSMTYDQIVNNVYTPARHKNSWRGHRRTVYLGPRALAILKLPIVGYTNASYARAINRACKRAGVPHWHPHQLRHLHATIVRKQFGLDGAQAALGHASSKTTEIYAEITDDVAKKIAEEIG